MAENMPKARRTVYTVVLKRLLDILLSSLAIIVLSPLLIVIAVLELIYHGRPILFKQLRPGRNEKEFAMYKFRSMTNEKNDKGELLPGEQRVTRFGRFLRRFSLDELPELFCIFTGKMSIIGPRPLAPAYIERYSARQRMRHLVRPGLACVSLKPMKTWTWDDQFENDIWYVEHCSFLVDVKMIFAVLREVIKGSEYRVNDTRGSFMGSSVSNNSMYKDDSSKD